MNESDFGQYLKALRKARKMTIRKLEEVSGVSNSYISQLEIGVATATPEIIRKLSQALGCTHIGMMIKAGHVTEEEVFGWIERSPIKQRTPESDT